jgi:hypothetical protein
MKFHKQLKVPGLNQEQIIEGLKATGMKMRPMREEYYGQKKFKPTNTMSDFVIVVEDELLEVRANGGYNVFSFLPWLGRKAFNLDYLTMKYTKSDIGYEKDGWVTINKDGHKVGERYTLVKTDGTYEEIVAQ